MGGGEGGVGGEQLCMLKETITIILQLDTTVQANSSRFFVAGIFCA